MIEILPFQPVLFKDVNDTEECLCPDTPYCQIVNPVDETQYQIKSLNAIINGNFANAGNSWETPEPLRVQVIVTNESAIGLCDGSVALTPLNGTDPYQYSLNGGTLQSNDFFENLCEGCYFAYIVDSIGLETSVEFCVYGNVNCSTYKGASIQDLINDNIQLSQLYNCTLGDIQP